MSAVSLEQKESARLYRLLHRGSEGDESFYVEACAGAGSVLELGCGFGRLLAPLALAGIEVSGVDRDQAMLELATESIKDLAPEIASKIELHQSDMTAFRFDRKYDRILIPFNGLYCLPSDDEALSCFRNAKDHLADGGRLLFDVYRVDPEDEPDAEEEADQGVDCLTTILDGEREIDVREKDVWNPRSSTVEVTYLFTLRGEGSARQVRQTIVHRYMAPQRILELLDRAGLQVISKYGGFGGESLDGDSVHLVVEAG
jgi:SAM-dependent methyltransferase